jgi:hypothetical protein
MMFASRFGFIAHCAEGSASAKKTGGIVSTDFSALDLRVNFSLSNAKGEAVMDTQRTLPVPRGEERKDPRA